GTTAAGPGGNLVEEPAFGPGGVTVGPGGDAGENSVVVTTPPPASIQESTSSSGGTPATQPVRPSLPSGAAEDGPPVRGGSGVRVETAPVQNGRLNSNRTDGPYNHHLDRK